MNKRAGMREVHRDLDAAQNELHQQRENGTDSSAEKRRDDIVSTILLVLIVRTERLRTAFFALAGALVILAALLILKLV